MAKAARSTAEDWTAAAYARFLEGGLAAVRVEAVARDLGATKGSFYWHFADRAELVRAVIGRWEQESTDAFIALADVAGTPRERLERLFVAVGRRLQGETRLYAEARAEGVVDAVTRVSDRRIEYVAAQLRELGVQPDEARHRGVIALAVALGLEQLTVAGAGELFGEPDALTRAALDVVLP